MKIALLDLVMYLLITINVSINAHLKKEFKLTYASMGQTEFRIIMIIINTLFATTSPLTEFSHSFDSFVLFGSEFTFKTLDYIGIVIVIILAIIHLTTVRNDIKGHAEIDPMPGRE